MSTDATIPAQDAAPLPSDVTTCQQMLRELLKTVAELRSTIDKQQSHIHYLVRMTFGRRSERYEGPTLFDGFADSQPQEPSAPPESPVQEVVVRKRRGHGRRQRPAELPRQCEVLDITEAERNCPSCGEK